MYDKGRFTFVSALAGITALAMPAAAQIATSRPAAPARSRPAAAQPQQQAPAAPVQTATPAAPISSGAAPVGYLIGVDDVLEVDVLGQSDFKTRARVQSDGTISASVTLPNQGANSIVATVTDSHGNVATSAAVVDTLDNVAPTVTITSAAEANNVAAQTITGTVVSGGAAGGGSVR